MKNNVYVRKRTSLSLSLSQKVLGLNKRVENEGVVAAACSCCSTFFAPFLHSHSHAPPRLFFFYLYFISCHICRSICCFHAQTVNMYYMYLLPLWAYSSRSRLVDLHDSQIETAMQNENVSLFFVQPGMSFLPSYLPYLLYGWSCGLPW